MNIDRANKIAMEILNAQERVKNRTKAKNLCDECKYNANDSARYCSGCDGRSKYIPQN